MPYVYDPNLDEDNENEGNESGAPKLASGSSSNEAPSGAAPSQAGKELDTGSGYQNLDKYLSTNQSQQFGQQVLGKVGDKIDTAKQNQANASQDFQNKVQSANYTPDQEKINQTLANPTQGDAKDFQKWMSQSYEGPKSLAENQDSWNQYWSGTNQAQSESKALGSEAGRFSLLDSYFGRPQYNFGEKSLDNLLIQQSGTGRETRNLQNQAAQLRSQGEQQAKNLQGAAATRAGEVAQNRGQVNQAFNQAQDQAQGAINQTLSDAQAGRLAEQNAARQAMSQGQITRDQLAKLGLAEGQDLYNLDLGNYLTASPNLSREQVATDDQRARLDALSQLAGIEQSFLGGKQDMGSAYGFDQGRFQGDIQNTQNQMKDLEPQFSKGAMEAALNMGRAPVSDQNYFSFSNLLPSNDFNTNLDYIKQQRNKWAGDPAQQEKVAAIDRVLNAYNQYQGLNTGRRLGVV
jgi:hypothetical protein